jgi:predicted NAD/FAD-dependent oxidoreductase
LPQPDDTFSFIADNQAKGISAVPALTLHANADWSLAHWDDDRSLLADQLIAAAGRFVDGRAVVARRVRRWRFATPQAPWPEPCLVVSERPPVVLAGDAFAGPRVEGAFTSGRAAAAALVEVYGRS